jgi:hypothetical protein
LAQSYGTSVPCQSGGWFVQTAGRDRFKGSDDVTATRLEYKDGAPSAETAARVYEDLDLMPAVEAFMNAHKRASTSALRTGSSAPASRIFSELMGAKSQHPPARTCDGLDEPGAAR